MDKKKTIITGISLLVVLVGVFVYMNFFRTYTVTFNTKLGPGVKTQEVKKGDKVIKPDDPEFDGYTFIGWYLNDKEYNFDTPVNSSITLDAMWEEN